MSNIDLVLKNWYNLKDIEDQTVELCLAAVAINGRALQYVKDQKPVICELALRNYPFAIEYVREQNDALCLKAVELNGMTLRYVKKQSKEICLAAVKEEPYALEYVTPEFLKEVVNFLRLRSLFEPKIQLIIKRYTKTS